MEGWDFYDVFFWKKFGVVEWGFYWGFLSFWGIFRWYFVVNLWWFAW
jgi:hypothetical protein